MDFCTTSIAGVTHSSLLDPNLAAMLQSKCRPLYNGYIDKLWESLRVLVCLTLHSPTTLYRSEPSIFHQHLCDHSFNTAFSFLFNIGAYHGLLLDTKCYGDVDFLSNPFCGERRYHVTMILWRPSSKHPCIPVSIPSIGRAASEKY